MISFSDSKTRFVARWRPCSARRSAHTDAHHTIWAGIVLQEHGRILGKIHQKRSCIVGRISQLVGSFPLNNSNSNWHNKCNQYSKLVQFSSALCSCFPFILSQDSVFGAHHLLIHDENHSHWKSLFCEGLAFRVIHTTGSMKLIHPSCSAVRILIDIRAF